MKILFSAMMLTAVIGLGTFLNYNIAATPNSKSDITKNQQLPAEAQKNLDKINASLDEMNSRINARQSWKWEKIIDPIAGDIYRVQAHTKSLTGGSVGSVGFNFLKNEVQFLMSFGSAHICGDADDRLMVAYKSNYNSTASEVNYYSFKVSTSREWLVGQDSSLIDPKTSEHANRVARIFRQGDTFFRVTDSCGTVTDFTVPSAGLIEAFKNINRPNFGL